MKMRKLFTSAAVAMMLVTMTTGTATATPFVGFVAPGISVTDGTVPSKVITKDYDVTGFTGLEVSGIVEVVLKKSDTYKVSVSIPESLEKYLIVRAREGELKIALTNLNERMAFKTKDVEVIATIEMPMLRSLEMSGATKLSCSDTFDVGDHTFKMELSGASKVKTSTSLCPWLRSANPTALSSSFLIGSVMFLRDQERNKAIKTAPAAEQTPARQTGGQSLSGQPSFGQSSVQSLSAPAAAQPAATQQFPSQNGTEQP